MKNMIKVLWYIIVSATVLTMLVLVTAKVYAHGDGKCITDPRGNVFLRDDSWVEITGHLKGEKLNIRGEGKEPYLHGHQQQYYDADDNPTAPSTSFWDIDFDDPNSPIYIVFDKFYVDCPTASPQPEPPTPRSETEVPRQSTTRTTTQRRSSSTTVSVESPGQAQGCQIPRPEPKPMLDEGLPVSDMIDYEWKIIDNHEVIGFPIRPVRAETVGDLHDLFQWYLCQETMLFQVFVDERWVSFSGRDTDDTEVKDIPITPHLGIMANLTGSPRSTGYRQEGEILDLQPGVHLIGLPELPANFQRASDFVAVDGIEWVKVGYSYKLINSINDSDDQDLRAGQAVRVSVTEPVTLDLRGTIVETLAAPSVRRRGTLAMSWGAMKR